MDNISLKTGVKEIAIRNEDDEVVTILKINTSDSSTFNKFNLIAEHLHELSAKSQQEIKKWYEDYGKHDQDITIEDVCAINSIRTKFLKNICDELDELFGKGTIEQIYGNIIPDEVAITEFVDSVTPIVSRFFNERIAENKKKYSSGRKPNQKITSNN